jgi:2-polyprenyl-6-methoxyphenol hydroxylase-like FAD-dependent oxidoreductase
MRVAINGTGIAGPTLAYWLRRFGHEPVLFERTPAPRTGGYIIDFWGVGYEIAERMGVVPQLRDHGYLMERLRMVDAKGRDVAAIDIRPIRERLGGRFVSISRAELAAVLLDACRGIPMHFGTSIVGIDQDDAGATVTLSDGRTDRFDLVIGADGLHSDVRGLVFGPERRFETFLGCYVAAFRMPHYPRRDELTYVSHTVPMRHVARVSLRGDDTLALLIFRSDLVDGDPREDRRRACLRRVFGEMEWEVPEILARLDRADPLYFDRVSQIRMPQWTDGHVALVGDAAACASLLAGEGTGLAMLEAYVLAGELGRAKGMAARAEAAYESQLRAFIAAKQRAAVRFRGFFAPETSLGLHVRNAIVRLLGLPVIGPRLLAGSVGDAFALPTYGP